MWYNMVAISLRICTVCEKAILDPKRARRSTCNESCERVRLFRSKIRAREINKGHRPVTETRG